MDHQEVIAMANGDVHTMWDGEKWVNKVEGG
jgi:hypothetical protein